MQYKITRRGETICTTNDREWCEQLARETSLSYKVTVWSSDWYVVYNEGSAVGFGSVSNLEVA